MSAIHDTMAKLAVDVAALERENAELQRHVERLARENGDQCDDIEILRATAAQAGLDATVRQSLAMIARYVDEGDALDSVRVLACLRRALDAAKASKEAA